MCSCVATKNAFELWEMKEDKKKSKNWVVYAPSSAEKMKWVNSIEKYNRKLKRLNGSKLLSNNDSRGVKLPRSKSQKQVPLLFPISTK